ncbi:MAG: ATP-binding protein [Chromatiales bacterium]|nr:ATP-binding protein [Chromatiales bacterium]
MLIEFRVKNFRSLRDEQVLTLVASKDKTLLSSNAQETGVKAAPALLRSTAIYGANASGKSNLVKALQYMRGVVAESATVIQPGQTYNLQPFRLDRTSVTEPTEFEITFLVDGVRYQYGFSMTQARIVNEYLLVYKAFKPQRWFERYLDEETDEEIYEFSASFKGSKSTWQQATRSNALFLSMAVQLNSEQLRPVFDWITKQLIVFNEVTPLAPEFSIQMLQQPEGRKEICEFLKSADISIKDISLVIRKIQGERMRVDLTSGKREIQPEEIEDRQLHFLHATDQGEATFELSDESGGTRNLLFTAGPVLDILRKGYTLIIDEIDTSLHTLLVQEMVRLFHNPKTNAAGAQLIFTTHDTSLLNAPGLLRRDQIWFTEKDADQASNLTSLSEFSPRKNEALERGYLTGRYGGIPFIEKMMGLTS